MSKELFPCTSRIDLNKPAINSAFGFIRRDIIYILYNTIDNTHNATLEITFYWNQPTSQILPYPNEIYLTFCLYSDPPLPPNSPASYTTQELAGT